MRPRTIRVIAIALAVIVGGVALLGWDLVYERHVTDAFLVQPQPSDDLTTR